MPRDDELSDIKNQIKSMMNKKDAYLKAYAVKAQMKMDTFERTGGRPVVPVLRSLSPIRPIASIGKVVPKIVHKWWQKEPTRAGSRCNTRQRRLADESDWTGTIRMKYELGDRPYDPDAVDNDLEYSHPLAKKLLISRSYAELRGGNQPSTFKGEVMWRSSLRGGL